MDKLPKSAQQPTPRVRPRTPCIGVCSTGIGDDVCRGCKRFEKEVIGWNGYTDIERQAVLDRLDSLLIQTMKSKFLIADVEKLNAQIRYQQIQFDDTKDPYCWLFQLLRYGAGQIDQLDNFGVVLNLEYHGRSLPELKAMIDQEFYDISCAYHQRYILPGESL
ncbi:MAG: DUF1289 domain-containing protein [Cellvibrionaceae bacterium]